MILEKGHQALAQKKAELATLLFHAARKMAALDPTSTENAKILTQVKTALKSSDPLDKVQASARASAAKSLLGIAKRYLKKGWVSTARPFIEAATQIDAMAVSKAGLVLKDPEKEQDKSADMARHFRDLESPWELQGWTVEKGTYVAPWDGDRGGSGILSAWSHNPGYRIDVEMLIKDGDDAGGIILAFKGARDLLIVSVAFTTTGTRAIRLLKPKKSKGLETLALKYQDPGAKKRHDWCKLIIEVRPEEVSFGLDGFPLEVVSIPGSELDGKLGLDITSGSKNRERVRFRNFTVRRLAK